MFIVVRITLNQHCYGNVDFLDEVHNPTAAIPQKTFYSLHQLDILIENVVTDEESRRLVSEYDGGCTAIDMISHI